MSRSHVTAELRRLVWDRADRLREYCLIDEEDTFFGCEVDHIVSEKHGGETAASNLALSCIFCNRNKGTDVGSLVQGTDRFVRFFNPRTDRWPEHFRLGAGGVWIVAQTEIAEATVRILRMNDGERLSERDALRDVGRYPSPAALARMRTTD